MDPFIVNFPVGIQAVTAASRDIRRPSPSSSNYINMSTDPKVSIPSLSHLLHGKTENHPNEFASDTSNFHYCSSTPITFFAIINTGELNDNGSYTPTFSTKIKLAEFDFSFI
ncbi:hypothetical protein L2E82_17587 [Cichorium intybus]|uniref:Uncharacterized protein n=1 Tax=Cichorium intybus TaxID=13427 RepID=A0ACB9F885_CICIN|nr:hypothetical protein L2E82_17587 [Cichorium intybus]